VVAEKDKRSRPGNPVLRMSSLSFHWTRTASRRLRGHPEGHIQSVQSAEDRARWAGFYTKSWTTL